MAYEKIQIQDFGGITKLEAEFKQINIFIGPQASGKSITVKLLFFFKNIFSDMLQSVLNEEDKRKFKSKQIEKFHNFFPREAWGNSSFSIAYNLENEIGITISRRNQDGNIKLEFTEALDKVFTKLKNSYRALKNEMSSDDDTSIIMMRTFELERSLESHLYKALEKKDGKFCGNQFFIPAGRSFFANLQSNIFSFLSENRTLDPFLIEFGSIYERFKEINSRTHYSATSAKNRKAVDEVEKLISEILGSDYTREKNKDFLVHEDKRKVNLANASSGQQEILPLLIILKLLLNTKVRFGRDNVALFIEEPEAHLFPSAQNKVVKLLARLCNFRDNYFQIFITTHSPYVLTSFNNLFLAGQIIRTDPGKREQVENYIRPQEILFIENVSSYSLENGKCFTMLDHEAGLIDAKILDGVSGKINLEFDNLLNIQYGD
ncbi:AAA family ATPase [Neisseria sp.]|uniref:AAA family ATPase n=1 Tax=Neisseria sp. TaxID=192066 RepID=UPI0026DCBA5F|nr:AAA family ATPase [Neisseria sp.]MDO4226462.1 AAA family ATPase [Neisseria sp.]